MNISDYVNSLPIKGHIKEGKSEDREYTKSDDIGPKEDRKNHISKITLS